jgi:hypothetical protein
MGRLDDKKTGPVVMIKVANLGPAEKLVRRGDGTIMVESYGGSWRNPPFIKLV